jgi:hypothetical protein
MAEPSSDKPAAEDRSGIGRFRYEYGAQPLHLLAVLTTLALAGYAFLRIFENPSTQQVLIWLAAAVIAHDFIALPFYSALIRIARAGSDAVMGFAAPQVSRAALNHLRFPAGFSLITLMIGLPLIFEFIPDGYLVTTGLPLEGYLTNWLLFTAAVFAISAVVLATRIRRSGQHVPERGVLPPDRPGLGWKIASRVVLGIGLLLVGWVAAALVVGLISNPPF